MAENAAGCFFPFCVGGWMCCTTIWLVLTSVELKFEFATGAPDAVKSVVFRLVAWAIWSGLSHQYWPMPASSWTGPTCMVGFTWPPNIHPSGLLLIWLKVHCSAKSFT